MKDKSYLNSKITKRKNEFGYGLYANKSIHKDEIVIVYTPYKGQFLTGQDFEKVYLAGEDYDVQVDENLIFAPIKKDEKEIVDYINHSCDANCGFKGLLTLVAIRDIKKNEEVTFDYATSESTPYKLVCRCKSRKCRKVVTGEDWRISTVRKKYRGYFQPYLEKKIIFP